jgi:hypothetical protein
LHGAIEERDVRKRPNLTRLLVFLAAVGTAAGVATAVTRHPESAVAEATPGSVVVPTPTPTPGAPLRLPVQDCTPGTTGTYVGRHGNVNVRCELSPDGSRWEWTGIGQRDNAYASAGVGATVTDSTGATWAVRMATGGSKVWVWLPKNNTNWHPPTRSYPNEGVTPD